MKWHSVNKNDVFGANYRFDAAYHLSDGVSIRRSITNAPNGTIKIADATERIFYGIRANRVYVDNREFAIPFMTGANIMLADLSNTKLVSKKHTPGIQEMTLKEGWVMVTRSGTVGQTAWSNKLHAGKYGSEDIIRVVPNDKIKGGMLYSFLASKYGHSLLTQGSFGAVIQHIEPSFIGNIDIPIFPIEFQSKVDELVRSSASLREEAADLLKTAQNKIDTFLNIPENLPEQRISIKSVIQSHNTRFEGSYFTSKNRRLYNYIINNFKYKTLKDYTERIFRPGIFKREYVEKGVMFLGGADIMMAIPHSEKQLSFRQVERMPELKVKKGWMLVTCGGTIGNTVYIDKQLEQCVISQHVMRIVPKESVPSGFLYAFLSSRIGYELITLFTYGAVIPSVEPHHLELVPIPDFDEIDMQNIDKLVQEHVSKIEEAKEKELLAIQLVEQEIEKWNK